MIEDLNLLYKAFKDSKKNSNWKPEVQKFEMNWLTELALLQKDLSDKTYKTSNNTEFIINERGKTRRITSNKMRDRVVRHVFCDNVLYPNIEKYLIYDNGASRKGKGISFTRNRLLKHLRNYYHHFGNDGYILLMDFSKYYDNIRHDIIKNQFKDYKMNYMNDNATSMELPWVIIIIAIIISIIAQATNTNLVSNTTFLLLLLLALGAYNQNNNSNSCGCRNNNCYVCGQQRSFI